MKVEKPSLFQPRKRFAMLINRWDDLRFFSPPYTRLTPSRGNETVFKLGAALQRGEQDLSGEIRATLRSEGHDEEALKAVEIDRGVRAIIGQKTEVRDGYERLFQCFSGAGLSVASRAFTVLSVADTANYMTGSTVRYDELLRVFPDSPDLPGEVYNNLAHFRSLADENSLTLFFIRAHGLSGQVAEFNYSDLLARMDQIAGKKVFISFACYSGSLVEMVRARPRADNYAVFSSTTSNRQGTNWCEDDICEDLCELIKQGKRLSEMLPRIYGKAGSSQATTVHLGFDAIL